MCLAGIFGNSIKLYTVILVILLNMSQIAKAREPANLRSPCTGKSEFFRNGHKYRCGCWRGVCWSKCPYLRDYEWCTTTDSFITQETSRHIKTCKVNKDCQYGFKCSQGSKICRWHSSSIRDWYNDIREQNIENIEESRKKKSGFSDNLKENTDENHMDYSVNNKRLKTRNARRDRFYVTYCDTDSLKFESGNSKQFSPSLKSKCQRIKERIDYDSSHAYRQSGYFQETNPEELA